MPVARRRLSAALLLAATAWTVIYHSRDAAGRPVLTSCVL